MRTKRAMATFTTLAAASLAAGVMLAPAAAAKNGNGKCSKSEICVYKEWGRHASEGYYDLGSPALKNFHNRYFFKDGAYLGDEISSWRAGSGTSCKGFKFFMDVNHKGASIKIAKGTKGDLRGPGTSPFDDELSSYSKYGC